MSVDDVLRFVTLVASGVTAGILVVVLVAVMPAMLALPDAMALRYKQKLDPLVDRVNPPAVMAATLTGVLVLVLAHHLPTTAVVATAIGVAGSLGVAVISMRFNMRINRRMADWSSGSPPTEFRRLMARWSGFHRLRTLAGLAAFFAYVVAVLAVT
jgi:uncharacterized membrane protein